MAKHHTVPIPDEQVSPKGPHDSKVDLRDAKTARPKDRSDRTGNAANTKQNTTHQGFQQNR